MKYVREIPIVGDGNKHYYSVREIEDNFNSVNIVEKAIRKSQLIMEKAQVDYSEELDKAYQEGLRKAEENFVSVMIEHSIGSAKLFERQKKSIIDIVILSVKNIIGEMPQGEVVEKVVSSLLNKVKEGEKLIFTVHPTKKNIIEAVLKKYDCTIDFSIHVNSHVDCEAIIVDTPSCAIEGGVKTQLSKLKYILSEQLGVVHDDKYSCL